MPRVEFALAGTLTRDVAPVTVADDVLSFALAVTSRPDELRITLLRDLSTEVDWPGCTGARCALIQTPAFTHELAWR
jgi:hypothetical protein